jgi:threonylcarbamoyladenosine tRNA methylthiotransferase MtaB
MRVAFTTLGCRLNLFETEAMRHRLGQKTGAGVVEWEEEAEIYVINSCTVTTRAEKKCRQLARAVKRRRPDSKVVVVGCYVQVNGEPLMKLPEIDGALGNEEKKHLEDYLDEVAAGSRILRAADYPRRMSAREGEWIEDFAGRSRATIKVQEGCNMRCTFCAIWSARGPSRSREPREIVQQAQRLATNGYEEIVLGGVHLGHYGRDLLPRTRLHELLTMLLDTVDPRVRFRLSSIDPSEVDARLVRLLVEESRLCRYLHLSLQSGSDAVLRQMRRAYSATYFRRLVAGIAQLDPDFGLGADLIVGFPNEDEAAFAETAALLESTPISFYHVFPYSDRPGTVASRLPKQAESGVVVERAKILREAGKRKRTAFLRKHLHGVYEGVVEGLDPLGVRGCREIMLEDYATVWAQADRGLERKRVELRVESMDEKGRLRGVFTGAAGTASRGILRVADGER